MNCDKCHRTAEYFGEARRDKASFYACDEHLSDLLWRDREFDLKRLSPTPLESKSAPTATLTRKSATAEIKAIDESQGIVQAYVNTLGMLDYDGEIIAPGAFTGSIAAGKMPAVCWMHDWSHIIGKVVAASEETSKALDGTQRTRLLATMQFDMADPDARAKFGKVRQGMVTEWSVGFYSTDEHTDRMDGKAVRVIDALDWCEVSPVLRGASPGTTTVSAKELSEPEAESNITMPLAEGVSVPAVNETLVDLEALKATTTAVITRIVQSTAPATSIPDAAGTDSALALLDEYRKRYTDAGGTLSFVKEGRRNSQRDASDLQAAHDAMCRLGASCHTDNTPKE